MPIPSEIPSEMVIRADTSEIIEVERLGNFLRDLVFLHDRLWLIDSKEYSEYPLDASFFYTRTGRPVPSEQRLQLTLVSKESPLHLGILIPSVLAVPAAAWGFFQIIRSALLLPGELRIQKLTEQKLRRETGQPNAQMREEDQPRRNAEVIRVYQEITQNRRIDQHRRETELRLVLRDVERIRTDGFQITEVEVRKTIVRPADEERR